MTKLGLLNTTIATTDGIYEVRTVDLDTAQQIVQNYVKSTGDWMDSAIGHESTAQIMTELLGQVIPVNRQQFAQAIGQDALVFKLKGSAPEGVILSAEEIEAIGYEFKVMTRTA
jgi:hypothetical protein